MKLNEMVFFCSKKRKREREKKQNHQGENVLTTTNNAANEFSTLCTTSKCDTIRNFSTNIHFILYIVNCKYVYIYFFFCTVTKHFRIHYAAYTVENVQKF